MVQPLVIYPDERINCTSTDVRAFNQTLWDILEDMKDTMEANNLEALSAIEIAYPYNIVLIKSLDGEVKEYINPRIIKSEEPFNSTETSTYYPDITVTIKRYAKLKLIYEDRFGKVYYEDIDNRRVSAILQREIDHTFGGTILDRVTKEQREAILKSLREKGYAPPQEDICPTFSKKDYFVSFSNKLLFFMGLSLFTPLFNFSQEAIERIYLFNKIAFPLTIILMIAFFFYAQYEAKRYRQCTSCQVGNNIGVVVKRVGLATALFIANYFILN